MCTRARSLEDGLRLSSAVFLAEAITVCLSPSGERLYGMRVERSWKGAKIGEFLRVRVPPSAPRVGLGDNLLVFGNSVDGVLVADPCMGVWQTPELQASRLAEGPTYERSEEERKLEAAVLVEYQRFEALEASPRVYPNPFRIDMSRARCGRLDVAELP